MGWLEDLREERKKKYKAPKEIREEGSVLDTVFGSKGQAKKKKKAKYDPEKYEDGGVVTDEPLLGEEYSEEEVKKKAKLKALMKLRGEKGKITDEDIKRYSASKK